MDEVNQNRPASTSDPDTLLSLFRSAHPAPGSTGVLLLYLPRLKKSVIPYRTVLKPSNDAGCSQYTYLKKTYRRYAFPRIDALAINGAHSFNYLNPEN